MPHLGGACAAGGARLLLGWVFTLTAVLLAPLTVLLAAALVGANGGIVARSLRPPAC
jgi:hypothetical protein